MRAARPASGRRPASGFPARAWRPTARCGIPPEWPCSTTACWCRTTRSSPVGRCTGAGHITSRTRTSCRSRSRITAIRSATGTSGCASSPTAEARMIRLPAGACLAVLLAVPAGASAQLAGASTAPALIPRPVRVTVKPGSFTLSGATVITTDRASRALGEMLADYFFPATGFRLAVRSAAPGGARVISVGLDATLTALGEEGYRLEVSPARLTIRAARPAGAFYAIQTLRQLLPAAIFRQARVPTAVWTIPPVSIEDSPRFRWRGHPLGVAPHFLPKEVVKKLLDLAALHKLNRLHLHLTDDQGGRIEIRQYPRLTQVGAWRRQTIIGRPDPDSTKWRFDGPPHRGFYTHDGINGPVRPARGRGATSV